MKVIALLSLSILLITIIKSQTPPTFPDAYELGFNETAKFTTTGSTTGKIFMDTKNNRQLIQRQNGLHDRYCGSVYKTANTPCNHYTVDNKRFLDFPEKKYCCFCCDSSHGCGIVSSDWLVKANATYQGTEKLDAGQPYLKWSIKGLQENLYYHKNDTVQTPRRLYQVSDDLMDFTSYKVGPIDPKVFVLPSYCTDKCGLLTICAGLRAKTIKSQ